MRKGRGARRGERKLGGGRKGSRAGREERERK